MSRLVCCVAHKAAPVLHPDANDAVEEEEASVRRALEGEGLTALQRRAGSEGCDEARLSEAVDSDRPKAAVIDLIVGQQKRAISRLRGELLGLGLTALQKRAAANGVDAASLEAAVDGDSPRDALVQLIFARRGGRAEGKAVVPVVPAVMEVVQDAQTDPAKVAELALRQELQSLRLSVLQKRAADAGVDQHNIDTVLDGDEPKTGLIALVMDHAGDSELEAARKELQNLGLAGLQRSATNRGVSRAEIEKAMDADDPKTALIEVLLAVSTSRGAPAAETGPKVVHATDDDAASVQLRQELQGMKLLALRRRASDVLADEMQLEAAMESDNPKAALVALILQQHISATGVQTSAIEEKRRKLMQVKLVALQKQAEEAKLSDAMLDQAMESEAPKAALVELLLTAAPPSTSSKPHFGAAVPTTTPAPAQRRSTKHVMLSYQWDHQREVKRVYDLLTRLGLKVWMDISGGMGVDVYDSMAEGVSNASVVVCFMSQKYQDSTNCMLELKFAKQSGIEVVPVMMEGGGWKASGWLGLVTAGSLWTPLHEEADFQENVRQLYGQLRKFIGGDGMADDGDDGGDDQFSTVTPSQEAKEELERLREAQTVAAQSTVSVALADPSQPATIPAGVPKLPARFHPTTEIQTLTRLVLSTSATDMLMSRVGFYGMGGIGKTVTGAAIARNDDVRLHFDVIVWLPLGQTPMIAKLQNLCHMQCTGKELSAELSSEEKKQALQQAMTGKRVLLCLDDVWEEGHETDLNFADVDAGSKVLISTRMKGLLVGAHKVEVGLPSVADSARMLLSAAGIDEGAPTGVAEVVDLCGRLPLALGIAGRLAASLGLLGAQDWSGMIDVLKEELRASHSGGVEEGMIRASLRGLKGSVKEQESIKSLLKMFALVPEDTHCPLDVLLLMFKATAHGGSSTATIMHIRKWLRILIDRSLVLGTIDRPSVHDLVLDFAVAQHTAKELREKHCQVVEAFRAARPADANGRKKFTSSALRDDAVCSYVCSDVSYHLKKGWLEDMRMRWVSDVPQDEIVIAAGHVMGLEKLDTAAERANADGDCWLAARCWSVASIVAWKTVDQAAVNLPVKKCLDACTKTLAQQDLSEHTRDDVYEVQLDRCLALALLLDVPTLNSKAAEIEQLGRSSAGVADPMGIAILKFVAVAIPPMFACEARAFGTAIADKLWSVLLEGMKTHPDPSIRYFCSMQAFNSGHLIDSVTLSKGVYDWDAHYSPGAEVFIETMRAYDFDKVHVHLRERFNADHVVISPHAVLPVALVYGAVHHCREYVDLSLHNWQRAMDEPNQQPETLSYAFGFPTWAYIVGVLPGLLTSPQQSAVAGLFGSLGLTWATIEEITADYGKGLIRPRGSTVMNSHYMPAEQIAWLTKAAYILITPGVTVVTKAEVLEFLPTVETVIAGVVTTDVGSITHATATGFNTFTILSFLCEKLELWQQVLDYSIAAMDPDLKRAGSEVPLTHINALLLKGRAYSALGQLASAAEAFEAAASKAHEIKMWTFEALALRDLKLSVLDQMGHGEHGSRRLGVVLRLLTGPAELLTPLLKGLDAAQLMACAAPHPGYEVSYALTSSPPAEEEEEDSGTAELRSELRGMRMLALQQRVVDCDVEASKLDDALESDTPKQALIELVLEHYRVSQQQHSGHREQQQQEQLRAELMALRMLALQQRALAEGVDSEQLDDAMDSDSPKDAVVALLMSGAGDGRGGRVAEGVPPRR